MIYREKLYPLCNKLADVALEMAGQIEMTVTARGMADPKILALSLLARTLQNFKACVLLIEREFAVEARVLARCCYENVFVVGGLLKEGASFADRMIEDDKAGKKGRVRFAAENENVFNGLSEDLQSMVLQKKRAFDEGPRPKFLKPKDISDISEFRDTYLAYSQFSGDAAHPTITALSRHWEKGTDGEAVFDFLPDAKEGELDETLHLAFIAVIGIVVVVNEMHGFTEAGKKLFALNQEFITLQEEKYGPSAPIEGIEVPGGDDKAEDPKPKR